MNPFDHLTPAVPMRAVEDILRIESAWGALLNVAAELDALEEGSRNTSVKAAVHAASTHVFEACAALRLALAKARR